MRIGKRKGMSENAYADELLNYALAVMATVKKLDHDVTFMERQKNGSSCGYMTSRWIAT